MLRAGPLLTEGCMRPWAERLLDLVGPRPAERCLDVLSESDVLSRMLARAVGPAGGVTVLDGEVPPSPGPCTVAVSLFGVAAAIDPLRLLAGVSAALDASAGRLAIAVWAGAPGAPHEAAVRAGLAEVGLGWPGLDAELALGEGGLDALPGGLRARRLRDVARFDGAGHLWAALVTEREPPAEITGAPADALAEAQRVCAGRLARHTAADGTLRIPVEALVVERAG